MSDTEEKVVTKKRRATAKKAAKKEYSSLEMAKAAAALANEKVGEDIILLDVSELTSYTSYILIVSGNNSRQTVSLGGYLTDLFAEKFGKKPLSREGQEGTSWLLLDFGDIIIHVFTTEERTRYDLEGFWKDAPRIDLSAK